MNPGLVLISFVFALSVKRSEVVDSESLSADWPDLTFYNLCDTIQTMKTDEELRLTTINLFGRLYKEIRNNELNVINEYIAHKTDSMIVHKLYYHLSIDKDKGCWLTKDWSYYSRINNEPAHRLSYKTMIGPILLGQYICHHCDRKGCRNPFHLFQGTQSDNMKDARIKNRVFGISIPNDIEMKRLKELDNWKQLKRFCK
jgi:hypothetical protein